MKKVNFATNWIYYVISSYLKMKWYDMFDIPKASLVVLINEDNKILSVSRKNNHNDKNIIGGKVDKGETFTQAAIREAKEETNLDVYNLIPIFYRKDGIYKCICYIGKYKGQIEKTSDKETGITEWVDFSKIEKGSFYEYNKKLKERLINIGLLV
jgi:ADP-ribose pyrophosphatase YjhB (NUDIX family)